MRLLLRWAAAESRAEIARLERALADEKAEHEATRRELHVQKLETDNLVAVNIRNNERICAEIKAATRTRAEHEGPDATPLMD